MRTIKSSFEVIVQVITLLGMAVYLKGMALGAEMMIVDPVTLRCGWPSPAEFRFIYRSSDAPSPLTPGSSINSCSALERGYQSTAPLTDGTTDSPRILLHPAKP